MVKQVQNDKRLMNLIIGLGNPGAKYQNNRHNVGHMFVDWITDRHFDDRREEKSQNRGGISRSARNDNWFVQNDLRFVKTDCFMNQSGSQVKKLSTYYKIPTTDLIVVHDDLDIPLGMFKVQKNSGPRLHNGISSIEEALGTKDFWRIRIGVDNRDPKRRIDGETYVLQDFRPEEKEILQQIFQEVVDKWKNLFHNE